MTENRERISWSLVVTCYIIPFLIWGASVAGFQLGYLDGELSVPFVFISVVMIFFGGTSTYWYLRKEEIDKGTFVIGAFFMFLTVFLGALTDIVYHITSLEIESPWTLQHAAFGLSFFYVFLWIMHTILQNGFRFLRENWLVTLPVVLVGAFLPVDLISHAYLGTEVGIDVLLSPTHLIMVSGMTIGFFIVAAVLRHWFFRALSFFMAMFWVHIYLNMITLYFRSVNFPFETEFGVQNPLTGLLATMVVSCWLLVAPTVMAKRFGFHLHLWQWILVNSPPLAVSALFLALGSGELGAFLAILIAVVLIVMFGRTHVLWPTLVSASSFAFVFILAEYWGQNLNGWTPYAVIGVPTLSLFTLTLIAVLSWGSKVVFGYPLGEDEAWW